MAEYLDSATSALADFFINIVVVPILRGLDLLNLVPNIDSSAIATIKSVSGYTNLILGNDFLSIYIGSWVSIMLMYWGAKLIMWLYDKITQVT